MKTFKIFTLISQLPGLIIFITMFMRIIPVNAQTTIHDHRNKAPESMKMKKSFNNHVVQISPRASVQNQMMSFDEADALFGKRTRVAHRPASFRYIAKMDTILITQKLQEGDNSIYKTEAGNTLYAVIKNGQVTKLTMKDSDMNDIRAGSSQENMVIASQQKPVECLSCKEICVEEIDEGGFATGGMFCWTQCTKVDCAGEHNAILLPDNNKMKK
ncbi:MAG: hypothetical protein K9G76_04570 [Bacteroidales bacterium]|nr:hypothetical protein [Bacteroidales bacterium]MCF8402951.1 hypothetical protein [Bacteroidales bacterium]